MAVQPGRPTRYIEPFAGGAGVGLRLLFDEYADEIVLNDLNAGIAAFWRCVFGEASALLERLDASEASVEEWHRQHAIYQEDDSGIADLGFATFFLNRTNRSGILDARPIGGLEQTGKWTIGARYDKTMLKKRIRRLAAYSSRVTVCDMDGIAFLKEQLNSESVFAYADPPYLVHGDDLYLDTFTWQDHEHLAALLNSHDVGWFLTYDADDRIVDSLYPGLRCARFSTSHTAAIQHVGDEYAVFARGLKVGSLAYLGSGSVDWIVA
jgi:DNA adenine methylase